MPKIVGIDFSSLTKFRTTATVRLFDGKEIELPLIKVRDAGLAEEFLHRNNTLAVQINTLRMRAEMKAKDAGRMADSIKDTVDDGSEMQSERGIDVVDNTMEILYGMQSKMTALHKQFNALGDEIHEFLRPYLEGTDVLQQLNNVDYVYTITVLKMMLYGEDFLTHTDEEVDDTEENPTIPPSQNS